MLLDALSWVIILLPLGVYLLCVGLKCGGRRPSAVWGAADLFAMGLGFGGLAVLGPFGLFFPQAAFNFLGEQVWLAIAALWTLVLMLAVGYVRPRIVVYAAGGHDVREHLVRAIRSLGHEATWAGNAFDCGGGGPCGRIEQRPGASAAEILSHGDADPRTWRQLQAQLERQFAEAPAARRSISQWTATGLALLAVVAVLIWQQPARHAEAIAALFGAN